MAEPTELVLADTLLACLRQELEINPNPPARVCLRVGADVRQDLSEYEDECCDGLAYVKVNQIYPSLTFPDPDEGAIHCATTWVVDLEMGVYRCLPMGDEKSLPTCDEWTNATTQVAYDSAAMRAAVNCFRGTLEPGQEILIRAWTPIASEGGCAGGTQQVTVGFFDPCE